MAVAGSLVYDAKIDKKNFEKGLASLEESANKAMKGVVVAATAVTTAIAGIGTAAISSYADLEQNIGGVETLFKNSSQKVINNANKAYKTAGMSANNYMSTVTGFSASLLQSLSGDTEKAADVADMALIDMADNANKMGTSMESIQFAYQGFAKQNYTMLDNLKLGYGGTKEEMQRLLEDAQKITGVKYDITNLNDVFQAIHVIQDELGITGTTAKEAEETISGSVASMKAAWDNFLNGSGSLDEFIETAKIAFNNIVEAAKKILPRIWNEVIDALPEELVTTLKILTPILISLGTALGVIWGYFKAKSAIENVTKSFKKLNLILRANPILLIVAAIAALVAGFIYLWNNCESFRNFWIGLWDEIKNIVSTVVEGIKKFFSDLIGNIKKTFSNIGKWFSDKFNEAKNAIVNVFSTVAQWFLDNVITPIQNFFQPLVDWFTQLFTSIWNTISSIFEVIIGLVSGCVESIKIIWGMITEWFSENIITPIAEFFTGLWEGISGAAQTAWDFIVEIWETVSTWFSDNIIQPIAGFFEEMWNKLKDGASKAWEGIKNVFSPVVNWFKSVFTNAWNGVKNVFSTGGKIFSGIKEGIEKTFKTVVNGIIRGINKVIKVPFDVINGALNKIRNVGIGNAKPFSGLPTISVPQIPELERGIGLAEKGKQYLLEGNGTEAVIPLDKNQYWVKAVAKDMIKAINQQRNIYSNTLNAKGVNSNQPIIINQSFDGTVKMDSSVVGRIVAPSVMKTIRTGGAKC